MRKYDNFEYNYPLITDEPRNNLKVIVVIPAFNEPYLKDTINSLVECKFETGQVEVIIVINESESVSNEISEFHQKQYHDLKEISMKISTSKLKFYPIYIQNIDKKIAGPGIARKIGMDEAVKRLDKINNPYGLIANLDGDTIVANNYLKELTKIASSKDKIKAYSIYFEHNLNSKISTEEKNAIIQYEFHLRYFINMQRMLHLPYAYYTIGSAMAVRAYAYKEAFGMNKRQAGEDFYFLHKFIKTGHFTEINSTKVFPSARISGRVPFGTGKAINIIIESGKSYFTYNYKSFEALETLTSNLESIYNNYENVKLLHKAVKEFLHSKDLPKRYAELKKHTKDFPSFKKRFYRWFDAFLLMKYLHFARDNYFENIQIDAAAQYILNKYGINENINLQRGLQIMRIKDLNHSSS